MSTIWQTNKENSLIQLSKPIFWRILGSARSITQEIVGQSSCMCHQNNFPTDLSSKSNLVTVLHIPKIYGILVLSLFSPTREYSNFPFGNGNQMHESHLIIGRCHDGHQNRAWPKSWTLDSTYLESLIEKKTGT